ncbi:MAG: hypothetical protein R2712_13185 [Vicinamibacterales bacterium]
MTPRVPAIVLAAVLATPLWLGAQSSVAGTWTLVINGPQGVVDSECVLTQQDDKVSGTMTSPAGEANVTGTMNGTTLSLAFNVVTQQGPLDITMTAEVTGSEMKGTLDFGMGTADFTGTKK